MLSPLLPMTRKHWLAALWIAGLTLPVFLSTIFMVGCCALPFHRILHKIAPLCRIAMHFRTAAGRDDNGSTSAPTRQKQEPQKRISTAVRRAAHFVAIPRVLVRQAAADALFYRSFIAQGALRCDRDVGLHLLAVTFRI